MDIKKRGRGARQMAGLVKLLRSPSPFPTPFSLALLVPTRSSHVPARHPCSKMLSYLRSFVDSVLFENPSPPLDSDPPPPTRSSVVCPRVRVVRVSGREDGTDVLRTVLWSLRYPFEERWVKESHADLFGKDRIPVLVLEDRDAFHQPAAALRVVGRLTHTYPTRDGVAK